MRGRATPRGEILLFLHADTALPPGGLERVASAMDTGAFVGGAFDLAIDSEALSMKLIARAACARSRFTGFLMATRRFF